MVEIRRIRKSEFDLYKEIRLKSLFESPDAFSANYEEALLRTEESWIAQSDGFSEGKDKCAFVARELQRTIGLCAFYKTSGAETEGELMQVWVSPDYRGKSVAKQLVDNILDWAREQKFTRIRVKAKKGNERAKKFYEKCGFSLVENEETIDEFVMTIAI